MRRSLFVVLAAATVGSLSLVPPAQADHHSWGGYHWARTANPFTLKVGNNVGSAWTTELKTAVSDWSAPAAVLKLTGVPGSSNKRCSMVAGTVQVCNGSYGRNGWLGLASISISGGTHITQGSAKMNDTYFNTATYNNPNEKLHVMCQEIGHTFGLGHTTEDGTSQDTCMDYFSNTGVNATSTVSTRPNAGDFAMLASIYSHYDATTTIAGSATLAARQEVSDDRGTWGQEIERGRNGDFSVFERDLGRGQKVITHVTWALDAAATGRGHAPA